MIIDCFSFSSPGGREHNEDSIGYRVSGGNGIFVVADGLGGHSKGEIASKCVVDSMISAWEERRGLDSVEWLKENLEQANTKIIELQKEQNCIMKSTAVALNIDDGMAMWAHVGDSRLYYIHDNELQFVTSDHSVAYKKYVAGEISRWQINTDEDQASLLRSLGGELNHAAELSEEKIPLFLEDGFLLCSDGVWEYLHDEEIVIEWLKSNDARDWGERLLLRIIDRIDETNDNLSLLTICFQNEGDNEKW